MPAGTIALTNNSTAVTGSGTSFTTDLKVGDFIGVYVGSAPYTAIVSSIASNTSLTLTIPFNGPTSSGLAWNAVPASLKIAITQQVLNDISTVARSMIADKANWQKIFSSDPSVTVTLADRSTFTGPSWGYIASLVGSGMQNRGRPSVTAPTITDINNLGPTADFAGVWNLSGSVDYGLTNVPEANAGTLEVLIGGAFNGMQRYTTRYGAVYVRSLTASWTAANSNVWGLWCLVSAAYRNQSSVDLNTLTNAQFVGGTLTNGPATMGNATCFVNSVMRANDAALIAQTLTYTTTGRIFTRTCVSGTWTAWVESLTTNSFGTAAGTAAQGNDARLSTLDGKTGGTVSSSVTINGTAVFNTSQANGVNTETSNNANATGCRIWGYDRNYDVYLQYYYVYNSYHSYRIVQNGTATFIARSNGACYAVSFNPTSDSNLKFNKLFIDSALMKSMSLRGMTYDINGDRKAGVIAQDAKAVLPESVTSNTESVVLEDGTILKETLSLDYSAIAGLHAEALKELIPLMLEMLTDPESAKTKLNALIAAVNKSNDDANETDMKMEWALLNPPVTVIEEQPADEGQETTDESGS